MITLWGATRCKQVDHATLEAIRIRAAHEVRGERPVAVIRVLGFSSCCLYGGSSMYRVADCCALKARHIPGRPRALKARGLRWLCRTVMERNPLQRGSPFARKTRLMIARLLSEQHSGVRQSLVPVRSLLAQGGLTCRKPLRSACQRDGSRVHQPFPRIACTLGRHRSGNKWRCTSRTTRVCTRTFTAQDPGRTATTRGALE